MLCSMVVCGCGKKEDYRMDNKNWMFTYVQSNSDGEITACAKEKEDLYPNAEVIDITCAVRDGIILITDSEENAAWELVYCPIEENADSIIYGVTYTVGDAEVTGNAVVAETKYQDKADEITLLLSIADKTICFTHEEIEAK